MISIIKALNEFHGITDDMAFEAAKRLAKHRAAAPYDVDAAVYANEQAGKKLKHMVSDSSSLSDEDMVSIKVNDRAKSHGGKAAYELLKKRYKQ